MADINRKSRSLRFAIWATILTVVGGVLALAFGEILLLTIVMLSLTACAFAFLGPWPGRIMLVVSLGTVVSGQLHWIGGRTVCLADADHPYLWQLEVDSSRTSFSAEDDGETISISFSSSSEKLTPGARFAEVRAKTGARIKPFLFTDLEASAFDDTRIMPNLTPPAMNGDVTLFAPRDAQFRADLPFGTAPGAATIDVRDLPILIEVDTDLYAPVGTLDGPVVFGERAALLPARFEGRNLILTGRVQSENTERAREIGRARAAAPKAVVNAMLRSWSLANTVSRIELNRYGAAFECRPETYQNLGIGWLFVPAAKL